MTVGERIRQLRTSRDIKMTDICDATGIQQGTISAVERDKYLPSAQTLIALSDYFGCSIDWLLRGEKEISDIDNRYYSDDALAVAKAWMQLPYKDQLITGGDIYRRLEAAEEEKKSPDIAQVT